MNLLKSLSISIGRTLVFLSFGLNLLIIASFEIRPDKLSALNIPPIWVWSTIGIIVCLLSMLFIKKTLPLIICGSWILTTCILADEFQSLRRGISPTLGKSKNTSHPNSIRVATINCNGRNLNIVRESLEFNPDIILTQESPSPQELISLMSEIGNKNYQVIGGWDCAIIAKGTLKKKIYPSILFNHVAGATLTLTNGTEIELLSLHLERAITRWDLWSIECWKQHKQRNTERRAQLIYLLAELKKQSSNKPIIFGGDFNASYQSNIYAVIPEKFTNAFDEAGKGIGNTFTNYFPIIRIDHIYPSNQFSIIDSRSVKTKNSDHRMVICDLLLN